MLKRVFERTGAVALGTGIGQGLLLLATPYLARHYTPAEFGTLALLTAGLLAFSGVGRSFTAKGIELV